MGKIKVKRKSTLIDMTAMSDVTVLLLTFFMLTSTFLQKEPTQVITPPSVSDEVVPIENLAQILVASDDAKKTPKVYLSVTGEADPDIPADDPGKWGTENLRKQVLRIAVQRFQDKSGHNPGITEADIEKFSKIGTFGVPMMMLHSFLNLDQTQQDEVLSNLNDPRSGIPLKTVRTKDGKEYNEFQIWMSAIRDTDNPELSDNIMRTGKGIAIKADQTTSFDLVADVLNNLRDIKMNKFTVMTALKTEND